MLEGASSFKVIKLNQISSKAMIRDHSAIPQQSEDYFTEHLMTHQTYKELADLRISQLDEGTRVQPSEKGSVFSFKPVMVITNPLTLSIEQQSSAPEQMPDASGFSFYKFEESHAVRSNKQSRTTINNIERVEKTDKGQHRAILDGLDNRDPAAVERISSYFGLSLSD